MDFTRESLEQLRIKIKRESRFVGKKPYSHNIIGLYLQEIARDHGQVEANKAIIDFKLNKLGWNIIPVVDEK